MAFCQLGQRNHEIPQRQEATRPHGFERNPHASRRFELVHIGVFIGIDVFAICQRLGQAVGSGPVTAVMHNALGIDDINNVRHRAVGDVELAGKLVDQNGPVFSVLSRQGFGRVHLLVECLVLMQSLTRVCFADIGQHKFNIGMLCPEFLHARDVLGVHRAGR